MAQPAVRSRWLAVGAVAAAAVVGIFGYQAGRASAGGDPAIPTAEQPTSTPSVTTPWQRGGGSTATPDPGGWGGASRSAPLTPPSDEQGPTTRAS